MPNQHAAAYAAWQAGDPVQYSIEIDDRGNWSPWDTLSRYSDVPEDPVPGIAYRPAPNVAASAAKPVTLPDDTPAPNVPPSVRDAVLLAALEWVASDPGRLVHAIDCAVSETRPQYAGTIVTLSRSNFIDRLQAMIDITNDVRRRVFQARHDNPGAVAR